MSRNTTGVKGITLREGDSVVSGLLIQNDEEETILTVTENGFGKRTRINEYTLQGRGGKGIINLKCSEKTGEIVEVKPVKEDEELMAITSSGVVIRTPVSSVSIYGRAAQGVKIMRTSEDEKVVAIAKIKSEKDEEKIISEEENLSEKNEAVLDEIQNNNDDFEDKFLKTPDENDEEEY